ncbi:MAG TPA: glycoside hydrolase family 95 protein [Opitutaceae bacterium]|jgi:alpha-L-fucosidase 2
MHARTLVPILLIVTSCGVLGATSPDELLWYGRPAKYWNSDCLHLGDGYMGASFYGGVNREVLELSEKSFWTGAPANGDWANTGVNPDARMALPEIRRAVQEGRTKDADRLTTDRFLGTNKNFGAFTSVGSLVIDFGGADAAVSGYRRSLDLAHSLGEVGYTLGGVGYSREYFCSYPDRVVAVRLRASPSALLKMSVALAIRQKDYSVDGDGGDLEARGFINGNHRPFSVRVKALDDGGTVRCVGGRLEIAGAREVVLLVSIATNYRLHYPDYTGEDPDVTTRTIIGKAAALGYGNLRARHVRDYTALYDRVSLKVAASADSERNPTDVRLRAYKSGAPDPGLKVLLFNLGRYMIISASRPGTLPANLQGVWNVFDAAPWAGNYQSNINLQEIYWSCGPTALLECQEAYIDWIRDLSLAGHEVARRCYGADGWVSHTTGNIYGSAAPFGGLSYAMYPMASAWHCQHVWEQFAFSQDKAYLRDVAYPLMKGAALFYVESLVRYHDRLIMVPSTSAEHGANETPEGLRASSSSQSEIYSMAGPAQDAEMLWDLFTNTIEAASILNVDAEFRQLLAEKRAALLPLTIGRYGQLQEWAEDIDSPLCRHRHIAHLYAVVPGRQIDPNRDLALAAAARRALEMRKSGLFLSDDPASGGNWSLADRMWAWGRLLEPERANSIFTMLIKDAMFENLLTYQQAEFSSGRDDLYKDPTGRFCHFQLDASAAIPGFMAEMLLQSHLGELSLLPALPAELGTGSVTGLRARGGFIVDLSWANGELTRAVIHVTSNRPLPPIRVRNKLVDADRFPGLEIRRGN